MIIQPYNSRRTLQLGLLCTMLALSTNAFAQLQFIPSVWLRGWMNDLAPGCVDEAGYLDPEHPALDTVHTAVCDANTFDLTGIQYLHHLKNLTIECDGAGVITPILPDSLERLNLEGFGFTEPISIPDGLRSLHAGEIWTWSGSIIGAIPQSLDTLVLHIGDSSLGILLMPLPNNLTFLDLITSGQITGLTLLPSSLSYLRLITNSTLCLPALPPTMDHLELGSGAVYCLPNLPSVQDPDHLILPNTIQICDQYDECIFTKALGGSLWFDADGDGLHGPNEVAFSGDAVVIDSIGIVGVTHDGYWMQFATTGTYSVTTLPLSPYSTGLTPEVQSATLSDLDPVVILPGSSYQLLPDITDVVVDITTTQVISGQSTQLSMTVRNIGSLIASGSVTVNVDPNLTITTISPDPLSVNGNSVTWTMGDLQVSGHRTWTLEASVPALTPGSMVQFSGQAITIGVDSDLTNNSYTWNAPVFVAYDPNDKLVQPSTASASAMVDGKELEYTIRFQNTGNYPASRVVITDTLSDDLVPSSMRYVSSSHPCSWWLVNGVLTFRFDPIHLPDSSADQAGSQGFVKFKIATQPALSVGQQINNVANIFFDINPPILTLPAVFEVVNDATGMEDRTAEGVHIGPNPASDRISIWLNADWGSNARVIITDVLGKQVASTTTQLGPTVLSLSGLTSGPLLVTVTSPERRLMAKVIKY